MNRSFIRAQLDVKFSKPEQIEAYVSVIENAKEYRDVHLCEFFKHVMKARRIERSSRRCRRFRFKNRFGSESSRCKFESAKSSCFPRSKRWRSRRIRKSQPVLWLVLPRNSRQRSEENSSQSSRFRKAIHPKPIRPPLRTVQTRTLRSPKRSKRAISAFSAPTLQPIDRSSAR